MSRRLQRSQGRIRDDYSMNGLYSRPRRAPPEPVLSNEEIAERAKKSRAAMDEIMRKQAPAWGVLPDDVDLWLSDPDAYVRLLKQRRDEAAAEQKQRDDEARIAVEGDTAMDDVSFGESGE